MGVAALCTRAASQCVCVWVYMCVCAPSNPFYRTCPSVPAPSVNAPRFLDKALLGLCSVSSAERDGVFVLTGWQLLGGAEFVVVSRRMLSAPAPADGDRALILHPTSWPGPESVKTNLHDPARRGHVLKMCVFTCSCGLFTGASRTQLTSVALMESERKGH